MAAAAEEVAIAHRWSEVATRSSWRLAAAFGSRSGKQFCFGLRGGPWGSLLLQWEAPDHSTSVVQCVQCSARGASGAHPRPSLAARAASSAHPPPPLLLPPRCASQCNEILQLQAVRAQGQYRLLHRWRRRRRCQRTSASACSGDSAVSVLPVTAQLITSHMYTFEHSTRNS